MKIAIIPARGGVRESKKNIKVFRGRFNCKTGLKEKQIFDKIVVSTDDEVISQTAKRYGAEVP